MTKALMQHLDGQAQVDSFEGFDNDWMRVELSMLAKSKYEKI